MGMTRQQAIAGMVKRHQEVLARATNFRCACCDGIYERKDASHVAAYSPQSEVMQKLIPGYNIATYVVCQECARMSEKTVFLKVEQYLIKNGGILRTDLKPLDSPGGHSPGHQAHKHGPNCSHSKGKGQSLFPGRG